MNCLRCGNECWDNRTKKMDDPKWKNAADFTCKDKACGWKSGQPASPAGAMAAAMAPSPPTPGVGVDAERVALYWNCLDTVMAGIAQRKLSDYFKSESVVAMVATLYIQRSKG